MPNPNTSFETETTPNIDACEKKPKLEQESSMEEFKRSLAADARAAQALPGCMDLNAARKAIEIISNCDGTLLTSGIGKLILENLFSCKVNTVFM